MEAKSRGLHPNREPGLVACRWPAGRPVRLVLGVEAHQTLVALAGAARMDPESVIIALILQEKRRSPGLPAPPLTLGSREHTSPAVSALPAVPRCAMPRHASRAWPGCALAVTALPRFTMPGSAITSTPRLGCLDGRRALPR